MQEPMPSDTYFSCGNKTAALLLGASGNLGRTGYRWVASHRNAWPIKIATRVLQYLNK